MLRRIAWTLLIIAMILAGCRTGESRESTDATPAENAHMETTLSGTPELAAGNQEAHLTIVDALGRQLALAEPPSRIVIAGRATALLAHTLYLFPEAGGRLAALEVRLQRSQSFYPLVDPRFDEVAPLERNAGVEQIAPLHPDVVLLKSYMAESLGDPLERLGIPVVYLDLETPEQFFRDVGILGRLLGDEARAEQIIGFYQDRLERLSALSGGNAESGPPAILVLKYSDRGGDVALQVPSVSWLQTEMVRQAGGSPIWVEAAQGGGWTVVGFEQIAAWNPDAIFVIYYPDDPAPIVERLREDSKWQALKAVQEGRLYGFVGDFLSWDQPDPRWILGQLWLARKIDPHVAEAVDLREEVIAFYRDLYRLESEVIEREILPLLSDSLVE